MPTSEIPYLGLKFTVLIRIFYINKWFYLGTIYTYSCDNVPIHLHF